VYLRICLAGSWGIKNVQYIVTVHMNADHILICIKRDSPTDY